MMQIAKITPSSAEAGRLLFLLLHHVQLLALAWEPTLYLVQTWWMDIFPQRKKKNKNCRKKKITVAAGFVSKKDKLCCGRLKIRTNPTSVSDSLGGIYDRLVTRNLYLCIRMCLCVCILLSQTLRTRWLDDFPYPDKQSGTSVCFRSVTW